MKYGPGSNAATTRKEDCMAISTTQPTFLNPRQVAAKTYILPSYLPVPGLGILPVNVF
jgi:hypothetical protein